MHADELVPVERPAVAESDQVDHAVAVGRVVATDRGMHGVLGVAQVHTVRSAGRFAFHLEVVRPPLGVLRPPVRLRVVVILGQGAQQTADDLDVHVPRVCASR